MKTKKFNKKLELSKRTIANLNTSKMSNIRGGAIYASENDPEACAGTADTYCGDCRSWEVPCATFQVCSVFSCDPCFTVGASCGTAC